MYQAVGFSIRSEDSGNEDGVWGACVEKIITTSNAVAAADRQQRGCCDEGLPCVAMDQLHVCTQT